MDHADTMRGLYAALNAGDLDGFGATLADDFVEHEETPGLAPTKAGVLEFFRMYRAAFPDLHMEPQDVLASGDKWLPGCRPPALTRASSWVCPRAARRSMWS